MTERHFNWLADLAIVAAVVAIAVIVLSPSGSIWAGGDVGRHLSQQETWIVHGVLFVALGFPIAVRLTAASRTVATLAKLTLALLLLALLGGLAESAQTEIASRSASYGDWAADTIGAAFGLWLGAVIARPLMLLVVRDEAAVIQRPTSE